MPASPIRVTEYISSTRTQFFFGAQHREAHSLPSILLSRCDVITAPEYRNIALEPSHTAARRRIIIQPYLEPYGNHR
jgi:hypothetical protein